MIIFNDVTNTGFSSYELEKIRAIRREWIIPDLYVLFEGVMEIPRAINGKFRSMLSKLVKKAESK